MKTKTPIEKKLLGDRLPNELASQTLPQFCESGITVTFSADVRCAEGGRYEVDRRCSATLAEFEVAVERARDAFANSVAGITWPASDEPGGSTGIHLLMSGWFMDDGGDYLATTIEVGDYQEIEAKDVVLQGIPPILLDMSNKVRPRFLAALAALDIAID
jgi:hypothetical protein